MKPKLLLAAAIVAILTGCATTPAGRLNQITAATKIASYVGTAEALRYHPEWREQFRLASDQLAFLSTSDSVDLAMLVAIANRLPIKELKSQEARIAILSAEILISSIDLPEVKPEQKAQVQAVAKAMALGINLGLAD